VRFSAPVFETVIGLNESADLSALFLWVVVGGGVCCKTASENHPVSSYRVEWNGIDNALVVWEILGWERVFLRLTRLREGQDDRGMAYGY
jgi:hypothetical protein